MPEQKSTALLPVTSRDAGPRMKSPKLTAFMERVGEALVKGMNRVAAEKAAEQTVNAAPKQ